MTKTEIIEKYSKFLYAEGIEGIDFPINDEFAKFIYLKYVHPQYKLQYLDVNSRKSDKMISRQVNFTKLSLLRVKYFRNGNSSKGIKEGFIYCITNPAFKGWYKIGSSVDVYDRLNSYQTYSPLRDYKLECYYFSENRIKEEFSYHKSLNAEGEWIKGDINSIIKLFKEKKINSAR
ncbi:hypothetical protein vBEclMUFV01_256 [Enterobacter phage vB_EclM-UFV01]|jgi:hypothetical protein|nr:hypothetical protein vBEclMUFV01_256 [Enterobacter phage vB_EclM-UFV01]